MQDSASHRPSAGAIVSALQQGSTVATSAISVRAMAPKVKLLKLLRYSIAKFLTAAQLTHADQEKKEGSAIMALTAQVAALKENAAKNAATKAAAKAADEAAADEAAVVMALQKEVDALELEAAIAVVANDSAAKKAWQDLQQAAAVLANQATAAGKAAQKASCWSQKRLQMLAEGVQEMAEIAKNKADQDPFKIAADKVAAAKKAEDEKVAAAKKAEDEKVAAAKKAEDEKVAAAKKAAIEAKKAAIEAEDRLPKDVQIAAGRKRFSEVRPEFFFLAQIAIPYQHPNCTPLSNPKQYPLANNCALLLPN